MNRLFKKICAGMMIATMAMSTCMVSFAGTGNILMNGSFENGTAYGQDNFCWDWEAWGTPEAVAVTEYGADAVGTREGWIQEWSRWGDSTVLADNMDGNWLHSSIGRC